MKITNPEDFARAEAERFGALGDVRTGTGIDVHAFGPGDHVWLGGLQIPHTQALTGHSDADVVLHALVDAILGALADGDIGSHFPPSDPKWKGAASDQFLTFAVERVAARGGRIAHLDVTIVCEAPKIGPHRDAHTGKDRGARRPPPLARGGEGDHQRTARLHRPARRYLGPRHGNGAVAVGGALSRPKMHLRRSPRITKLRRNCFTPP